MGVNTLPPGAPRSSSILGLGQGIRSERVNSLHRRQGDRVFSRASRPRGPGVHSQRAGRRGQGFVGGLSRITAPNLPRRDLGADAHGSRINVVPELRWSPGSYRQGDDPPHVRPTELEI